MAVSDGVADKPKSYGFFVGYLALTRIPMGMQRHPTRLPNAILPRIRVSLLSFLTHYLLYLDFLTSDDLCITAYCDNYRMINNNYVDRLLLF
jgi:hypothetical protein